MRLISLKYAIVLGLVSAATWGLPACSSDDSKGTAGSGGKAGSSGAGGASGTSGSAGAAGSDSGSGPKSAECGGTTCEGVPLPAPLDAFAIDVCCPKGASDSTCGLDTSLLAGIGIVFAVPCQEKNQPGDVTTACPKSPEFDVAGVVKVKLDGCCRPNGTCGYKADNVVSVPLNLGCVDSAPFLDGGTPTSCTPGADGGDGAAGSAGAAGADGSAGADGG